MNERIKEIIIEALGKEGLSDSRAFGHWALYDKHVEKFAELILTEVISTIYRSKISDKKQKKLVDELAYKFGMK